MNNLVPGAVPVPGILANYGAGVTALRAVVWHWTVGTNSLGLIAGNGLCAFLIAPDGTIYQTAPWDSVNYTQCEWNVVVQGIEVESLDGSITPAQIAALGYLTIFLLNVGAIPRLFYDGPRLPVGFPLVGVTNHRALHQQACAEHYDGFDQWVWDAIMVPPPPQPDPRIIAAAQQEETLFPVVKTDDGIRWAVGVGIDHAVYVERWRRDGTFLDQMPLGGNTNDRATILADGATVTIIARGVSSDMFAKTWNGTKWTSWLPAGGYFINPITTS